ncbi:hypothetical protein [Pinirhizobacter sp.]|jgi:hypothetical protein|uniref:hypothetical protein n=1 Tax=Pinirhizobacter sp. TaxID=2950432 RepID=UPI002F3FA747
MKGIVKGELIDRFDPEADKRRRFSLLGAAAGVVIAAALLEATQWILAQFPSTRHIVVPQQSWFTLAALGIVLIAEAFIRRRRRKGS